MGAWRQVLGACAGVLLDRRRGFECNRVRAERGPDGHRFTHADRRGPGRGPDPVHRGRRRRRQRRPHLRLDVRGQHDVHRAEPEQDLPRRRHVHRDGDRLRRQGRLRHRIDHRDLDPGQPHPSITSHRRRPRPAIVPFTTQLAATATDADGHAVTYAWDLDGDGTFETTERNPSLNLTSAGDKVVTLRATDPFGGVATRAVTIAGLAATPDPTKKYHVLVFSKTAGFRHGSIGPGITAIKLLGQQNNIGVDAIEDAALFTDAFLARYDAVIWLSTTGDVLNDTQQAAFERYIQAGGGYVGIHAASDTEYTWPWYGQLVGGYFRNHPAARRRRRSSPRTRRTCPPPPAGPLDARGRVVQLPGHHQPGGQWRRHRRQPAPTPIHVLLTVDESTYNESDGNTTDDDHPVSWCKRFDGGRMFYTALGHTNQSFTEAPFLQHLLTASTSPPGTRPTPPAASSRPPRTAAPAAPWPRRCR